MSLTLKFDNNTLGAVESFEVTRETRVDGDRER